MPSPNDQRSNAKNSNNPANQAANDHRAEQTNPTSAAFKAANDNRANQLNSKHTDTKPSKK